MRLYSGRTTLSKFLIEHCSSAERRELAALLIDVAAAIKAISAVAGKGALGGNHGVIGAINVQGEEQNGLDVLTNEIFVRALRVGRAHRRHGVRGERRPSPRSAEYVARQSPAAVRSARWLVEHRRQRLRSARSSRSCACAAGRGPSAADFLQPGTSRSAAGYAIYGPSTMLVLTSATARMASRWIARSATSC